MQESLKESGLAYIPVTRIDRNPYNPRLFFDEPEMNILFESIKQVGVLVPLLVYRRKKDNIIIILDGERRWLCVQQLVKEYPDEKHKWENIPCNVIEEPDMVSNILRMFNIHNVREKWQLMPTALKLEILMKELKERNNEKLSELTGLNAATVSRCKILLGYDKQWQDEMLHPIPEDRIRADFFIEMHPVLNLIEKNLINISKKYSRNEIIDKFLQKYKDGKISTVLDFRDLADIIRSMKKGEIEIDECEEIFIDILETDADVGKYVRKTYNPTKNVIKLQRVIEATTEQLETFKPLTARDRDRIQEALENLFKIIKEKIKELETFEDWE